MKGKLSLAVFLAVLVCFLMPFLDVSCSDQKIISLTGIEMMTGIKIKTQNFFGHTEEQNTHAQPYVICAFVCAVLGLGLSFGFLKMFSSQKMFSNQASAWLSFVATSLSGFGGFIFLLLQRSKIENNILEKGQGMITAEWRFGFWLACILFILASVVCIIAYFWERRKVAVSGAMIGCFAVLFVSGCSCNSDLKKAGAFLQAGMYDQAIELAQKVVNENPENLKAHLMLGQTYLLQENQELVKKSFYHALSLDSECQEKIAEQYLIAVEKLAIQDKRELATEYLVYVRDNFAKDNSDIDKQMIEVKRKYGLVFVKELTPEGDWDIEPGWYASGKMISFYRHGPRVIMKLDLTSGIVSELEHPSNIEYFRRMGWSLNEKSIAFSKNGTGQDDNNNMGNIWRFNLGDDQAFPVTLSKTLTYDEPCWLNNDRNIVFEKHDRYGDNRTIGIMDSNGANEKTIGLGNSPQCSPNTGWIIFVHEINLLAFNSENNAVIRLTSDGKSYSASFSPNNKKIVFLRKIIFEDWDTSGNGNLRRMGEYEVVIADFPSSPPYELKNEKVIYHNKGSCGCTPKWSPDGKQIVFCHGERIGKHHLWLLEL